MLDIVVYLGLMGILFGIGSVLERRSSFFQSRLKEESSNRFGCIDGLRGYLALGVLVHHAAINYEYFQNGTWKPVGSALFDFLGPGPVAMFFMITGFLFWGKAITTQGRVGVKRLLSSRVRRLYPMYLFALFIALGVVVVLSGMRVREPLTELGWHIGCWVVSGLGGLPPINGVDMTPIHYVVWSLAWEWGFYLALPVLAFLYRPRYFWIILVLYAAMHVSLRNYLNTTHMLNFIFGMVAAYLARHSGIASIAQWKAVTVLILLVLIGACILHYYSGKVSVGLWSKIIPVGLRFLLFLAFVFIMQGNTLFGILSSRASRFLGIVSYSLYLMHNLLLFIGSQLLNLVCPIKGMSMWAYWSFVAGCGVVLVMVSAGTYRWIEYPFISAKPKDQRRLRKVGSEHLVEMK